MSNRWWVVVNPSAGRPGLVEQRTRDALAEYRVEADVHVSTSPHHLAHVVRTGIDEGRHRFVSVGGDGTAHLVLNSLMEQQWETPPVLAILPAGSGSDFIRTFALPRDLEAATAHLVTDDTYRVDIGRLDGDFGHRWFLNVANLGVAAGSAETAAKLPRFLGRVRYTVGFWIALWRYKSRQIRVVVDGNDWTGAAITVVLANGQFFRGGMNIAPKALLGDGKLDVQVFSGPRRMAFSVMPRVRRGLHLRHKAVRRRSGSTIDIDCHHDWPIEADGEMIGRGPVQVTTTAGAIDFKI